jgi:flagella basal body P-ring formation protein FlgA
LQLLRLSRDLLLLAALCPSGWAFAAPEQALQSLAAISETAQRYAEQAVAAEVDPTATVTVGALDPRLRLPACSEPLDAFLPASTQQTHTNVTIGVRCSGTTLWTLYVPARIVAKRPIVVLTRPVPRGTVLTAQDIDVEVREIGSLGAGYFEDPGVIIGKVLTRNVSAGQVVSPTLLTGNIAVRRGQLVTLHANSGSVTVSMEGTALADGSVGERLRVKNNASARVVEGVVRDDGSVEIGP